MNRKESQRKKLLIMIAVMLILCVLALICIVRLAGSNGTGQETSDIPEAVSEEETDIPQGEEEPAETDTSAAEAGQHVYAHRGSQGDDEFTFEAYDRALEAGAGYIEADMVVSADGTIYVAHDDYAKDMTGLDGYFSGMSDSQIDGLKTKTGNSIIKLSDLFDKYGDSVGYIVDIKYASERDITAFTDIVRKYGYEANVTAASFYLNALRPVSETFPDMTTLYLCADQGAFNAALDADYLDILCVPAEIMTPDNLAAAQEHGRKFSAWTLNTEEEIRSAIDMGVDSYFTDDSALAVSLEKQYRTEQ